MANTPIPPQFLELTIGGETFLVRTFSNEPMFKDDSITYDVKIEVHPSDVERMREALERENG